MAIVHLGAKRVQGIKSDRVSDSLGSSADGTNSGVTLDTSNKKLGTGAYSLSGTNPVHFPNTTANKLLPSTDDFSITCWVYHTGHSDHQQIFRCQDSNGSSEGEFRINSSGTASQDDKLALTLNDGTNGTGGSSATVMSTNSVTQNAWVHLAVTRTGATVKLYINGTLETNQNTSGTFSTSSKWGITTPRIGRLENANETIQGKIDDLGVWHRVLTGTEITALYNSGTGALVSSLSDKSNLKANYTMDSTALTSLKGTADWTEDFSETTPTAWTEDSSSGYANNLEPYKGSVNRLWFDLDENTGVGVMGMLDSQNAGLLGANPSNTLWTFRFKINFTHLTSAGGSMWIGFTDSNNAASNGACRFAGCRIKTTVGIQNGSDNGGQALTASNRTDGGVATTVTTGTDYYVTVSRHNANTLVTTVRSGSHTGTLVGEVTADTLETATKDLRYWKIMNNRSSTNGAQLKGYLYDLEFFNDSATTTGCKNDASTTSELHGMTNLPANTIFEQTDDTPTYWWYNGTSWLFDGTTEKDLTSSSQSWTQVGDEIVKTNDTITATTASDDDVNGSTGSDRVYTTLPSTLSNTAHVTNFDLKITANAPSGDPDIVPIMYTAGTSAFGAGSQDGYGFDMYSDSGNGNNYVVRLIARDGTDNDYSSTIVLTPTTQYYCRLVRNSATLGTLNVYTDSARTTHTSGSPQTLTIASGSDRGKDCTHLQSSTWSGSASTSYIVSNVKLQNGFSEWQE